MKFYLSNNIEKDFFNPNEFSISTHPNPFNPVCNIYLSLNKGALIEIMINDIKGREIKLLNKVP